MKLVFVSFYDINKTGQKVQAVTHAQTEHEIMLLHQFNCNKYNKSRTQCPLLSPPPKKMFCMISPLLPK